MLERGRALRVATLLFSLAWAVLTVQAWQSGESQRERDEWTFIYDWLSRPKQSDKPKSGFVPDGPTATAIGEAVARALYGEDVARRQRPFRARLRAGVWTVMGSMKPEGGYGGVAIIQLRKDDGRVVFAAHTH
jgi:hypothetical protein